MSDNRKMRRSAKHKLKRAAHAYNDSARTLEHFCEFTETGTGHDRVTTLHPTKGFRKSRVAPPLVPFQKMNWAQKFYALVLQGHPAL
jgi:hypothetical protein